MQYSAVLWVGAAEEAPVPIDQPHPSNIRLNPVLPVLPSSQVGRTRQSILTRSGHRATSHRIALHHSSTASNSTYILYYAHLAQIAPRELA